MGAGYFLRRSESFSCVARVEYGFPHVVNLSVGKRKMDPKERDVCHGVIMCIMYVELAGVNVERCRESDSWSLVYSTSMGHFMQLLY